MVPVSQLLALKGQDLYRLRPEDPVIDAIQLMADKGVGALLVMEGDRLVGILSERDYARKVILKGRSSKDTPISAIMTPAPLVTVSLPTPASTTLLPSPAVMVSPPPVAAEVSEVCALVRIATPVSGSVV